MAPILAARYTSSAGAISIGPRTRYDREGGSLIVPSDHATTDTASKLASELQKLLGPGQVLTEPHQIATYRRFFAIPPRPRIVPAYPPGAPALVVRPRNAEDVVLVLQKAAACDVPVVPYGGGTGVMGGATPLEGALVLDLGAMNRILDLSTGDLLATVEPGVVLGDLASAAETRGLLFAHDPWSQPIATVGGAVETNGVGYLAAGYGPMGDQVRGLEVALVTGEIVSWNGAAKAPGPALWRLFIGSEGTLAVVTKVIVELYPRPETRLLAAFRFPTFADGFQAITHLRASGLRPTMIDFEEVDGEPLRAAADLYLAFDGPVPVVRAAASLAREICRAAGGTNRGKRAAERFWVHRHDTAYRFLERLATSPGERRWQNVYYANVAVPPSKVLAYCAEVVDLARQHGVVARSFGVWARPEFVSFTLHGRTEPLQDALDATLLLARRLGGSIEYVHGAGLRLAHLMEDELGSAAPLLRHVKHLLDPSCTLNPGKLGLCPLS